MPFQSQSSLLPSPEVTEPAATLFPSNYSVGKESDNFEMDEELYQETLPERVLLVAMLERAKNDLSPWTPEKLRTSAIEWFEGEEVERKNCFTFHQVNLELQLSARDMQKIKYLIDMAKTYKDKEKKPSHDEYKGEETFCRRGKRFA